MTRRIIVAAVIAGVALAGSHGCTNTQNAPPLAGPSELATSITMYASPDSINQDGASRSQITVQARDASNQPIANLPIRLNASGNGVAADVGQLSTNQIVTGVDGRAVASYTAPGAPRRTADALASDTILATPVGTDAAGTIARSVTIRLTSPAIPTSPTPPKASFTVSPANPTGDQRVYFDASASSGPYPISTYSWDFGDGSPLGSGIAQIHQFNGCSTSVSNLTPQTFEVLLTVTDSAGNSSLLPSRTFVTVSKCKA
jgi:hypothetical protein